MSESARPDPPRRLDVRVGSSTNALQPVSSAERAWLTVPLQDPDRVTDLLVDLRDAGIRLAEFGVQKPTLDEVFLAITGHGAEDTTATSAEEDTVLV